MKEDWIKRRSLGPVWHAFRMSLRVVCGLIRLASPSGDAQTPDQQRAPYRKIFIAGCPRSGTTWVSQVFASHPDVIRYKPESHVYPQIYEYLHNHGLRTASGWTLVIARFLYDRHLPRFAVGYHHHLSTREFLLLVEDTVRRLDRLPDPEGELAVQSMIREIYDRYFFSGGGTSRHLFVEKTPQNLRYAETVLRHFRDAKMIDVMRDGRDVCVSLEMRSRRVRWAPSDRRQQIQVWKEFAELSQSLHTHPELHARVYQVRYEKLKQNTEKEIAAMFDFAELGYGDHLLAEIARKTDFDSLPEGQQGPGQHHRKGVAGDWRNHFTVEDETLFKDIVGDLFVRCGYTYDDTVNERT
jgi:hypothetical protein